MIVGNGGFTVRVVQSLRPGEVQALAGLLISVVEQGASIGFLPPLSREEAEEYWRGALSRDVVLFIAEADGEIAGTVQLECAKKRNGSHRAEVNKLLVAPRFQRQGIGKALMQALEAEALRLGRTLLHLDTRDGDNSNVFYRSLGWIEVGTIPMWARSANGELAGTAFYYKVLQD